MNQFLTKKLCVQIRQSKNTCAASQYVMLHSLYKAIGDVTGKAILEIGCGDGTNLRTLKAKGAKRLVGIDKSLVMLEIAMDAEKSRPLGINYKMADARTMGKIGEFDICFVSFVLSYIETEDDLIAFFRTVYANLKPGGRFVSMDFDFFSTRLCEMPARFRRKFRLLKDTPSKRYIKLDEVIESNNSFTLYLQHYKKPVFDAIFREISFRFVKWENVVLSQEGLNKYGADYWEDYMKNPEFLALIAEK